MSSSQLFFIGTRAVSKPYAANGNDVWPPVDMVVMKPCVCGDFNVLHAESDIPPESLAALGLTEKDVRGVMEEVSEELERRTRCCWCWGWCCCIMLVIWWFDMCLQQCHCGITKCFCIDPALKAVDRILDEHNEQLKEKGVVMSRVADESSVTTSSVRDDLAEQLLLGRQTNTVYFDTWLIKVERLPAGP